MSEPNPATDEVTANAGAGGAQFAGWLIGSNFWPMTRLAFGTGRFSYEVDDVSGQRLPVKVAQTLGDDGNPILGSTTDAAWASGAGTQIAILKGIATRLLATTGSTGLAVSADATLVGFRDPSGNMAAGLVDGSGYLKVNVAAGGASGGTSSSLGAAVPAIGTAVGFQDTSGNLALGTLDGSGNLKVAVTGGGSNAAAGATGSAIPASGSYTALNVGGTLRGQTAVNPSGSVFAAQVDIASIGGVTFTSMPISAAALPLPAGAATAAKQPALGTAGTPSLDVLTVQGRSGMIALLVDGSAVTQPISAAALPLPTGAATAANQTTGNGSLSTIATNTTGLATAAAQTTGNASLASIVTALAGPIASSSFLVIASANFTRPANATPYVFGNAVANNTSAGSVTPLAFTVARANGGTGWVRRVGVKINDAAWAGATVRVHLYGASPTCANGDGGAWSTTESTYLGSLDVLLDKTFSDPFVKGFGTPAVGSEISFVAGGGVQTIYGILQTLTGLTPASAKVFTVTLETVQN